MKLSFVRRAVAVGIAAVFLASAPAPAQEQQAAIDFALERGRLLYALDKAAWVTTDDMMERVADWQTSGMRGYVTEHDGEVRNHAVVSREVFAADARPALSAEQRRLIAARDAVARSTRRRPCGNAPFNANVVPPASPDAPVDVYLMTPQTDEGLPVGGHFRATVNADGSISGERAFTNSCLLLPQARPGAVGLVVSHLLDPLPTEIHVFTAIAAGLPLYVGITEPRRTYRVTGEGIALDEMPTPPSRR
jgi:hypothetical protein